jgi:DNA-directed RNA polymerase specialized sigma24 family protein
MKKKKTWVSDVEDLLQKSVAADAASRVWKRFEEALEKLDPQSADLFHDYLRGATPAELANRKHLSQEEVQNWIQKIKRDVIQQLRQDCKVRQ